MNRCWPIFGVSVFAPLIVATYPYHGYLVAPCGSLNQDGIASLSRDDCCPSHATANSPGAPPTATGNVFELAGATLTRTGLVHVRPSSVEAE